MLLSFAACGREQTLPQPDSAQTVTAAGTPEAESQSRSDRPTEEGWLMTRLDMPAKMQASAGIDTDGDWLWISGRSQIDGAYNPVSYTHLRAHET